MKILSILFCLLTSSLCADFESSFADPCLIEASCRDLENTGVQYEDLNPTAVSEQENLPSGVIDGVNVVSGEYSTGAIDGYVMAPSRFTIDRTYHQNKEMRNGATGFHWRVGFLWKVFPDPQSHSAYIREGSGAMAYYDKHPIPKRSRNYEFSIEFINGIDNTFDDFHNSMKHLSHLIGGYDIRGVYNATHGLMNDSQEYIMGSNHIATTPVRKLHEMWDKFFDEAGPDGRFLMYCHSQGATHTMNALLSYSPERRKQISVVALCPGDYIYRETCADVMHYCSDKDYVPRLDYRGRKREKGYITMLKSHPTAKGMDHSFNSPTYEEAIKYSFYKFINSGNSL